MFIRKLIYNELWSETTTTFGMNFFSSLSYKEMLPTNFFFYIARFSTISFSSMWFSSCSCRLCRSSASFLKKQHRFLFLYYAEKHTISTIIHLRIFVRSWLEHALRTQAIVRPAFASRLSRLLSLYVFLQMLRVWGFTWPKINKKTW